MDPTNSSYAHMRDLKWTAAEKSIARKAFDRALKRELEEVIQQAKNRAAKIRQPDELWRLERFLSKRREDINRRYDFRRSVLPLVFGNLIREGCLTEEELSGLAEDKFDWIRRHAKP